MGLAREHVQQGLRLWNEGDFEGLRGLTAQDVVEVSPWGTLAGLEAVEDSARRSYAAFPDRRVEAHRWTEDGDTVVIEGEWSGTHKGAFPLPDGSQVPPTDQTLTFRLVSIFEVKDGKTVAHRLYWDQLPAMMQLGVIAPAKRP